MENYPAKFSPEARAAVEAELIRAGRLHAKRKREWKSDWSFPEGQSLQTCILSVFLVYAREAIELGKKGVWTVDQVHAQSLEGLRLITIEIEFKNNYNLLIERSGSSISRETQREFEASPEWQQFEDELLALADSKRRFFPDPFLPDASAQPLGDNPFPQNHPAHSAFEEATWKAKGAIAKLKLELLGTNFNTRAEFVQSLLTFRKRWFTATAFEATLIVGNEETAQWYERWVDGHAEWFLEDSLNRLKSKDPKADPLNPPFFSPEDLERIESDLKLELMRMVAHYKGVAASRVVEVIGLRNAARAAAATGLPPGGRGGDVERDQTIEIDVNLTDQQKDLLRLLVSMHESSGGAEFKFVRSLISSGLCYPGGISVPVANDETDFRRLERENLIDFTCTSPNVYSGKPTQLGITFVQRGFALFDAEPPPKEGEAPAAREPVVAKAGHRTDRPSLVDDFLHRCNEESTVGFKVIRKHIWLAVGHAHPRQFQYWQEGSGKATDEDDRNFRRILSMSPAEFLSLLKKKGISPSSS